MYWFLGVLILLLVGFLLRRVLEMDAARSPAASSRPMLRGKLQSLFESISKEIEAHTSIVGITLNDAFNERDAGRSVVAWRMVNLAKGEWDHLTHLVAGLHAILTKFLPSAVGVVPVRRVALGHFKSRSVAENVGLYEFLDQVLFSSKRRFAVQLSLLVRANDILARDFQWACREGELSLDTSDEAWSRLDYCFHDLDLMAKESLLAFHTLLACQSAEGAQDVIAEIQELLERGIRASVPPVNQ